jgi:hypothetical protein
VKLPSVFYWAFGGVGTLLLCIAAIIFYFNQRATNQYVHLEGVVVRNEFEGNTARPVIAYLWEGKELTYFSNTSTNPPAFEVGERVELFVNPSDGTDVWVNRFSERWLGMVIVGGIGIVFLGFLTLFHYLSER